MSDEGSYFQRDRGWHPPAFTPDYKTSVLRSPRFPLLSLDNTDFGDDGPGLRRFDPRSARQRSHPQLCQRWRCHRPADHRLWARARRECAAGARCAGRILAGQCGRALSPQEGNLSRAPSIRISAAADARSPMTKGATASARSSRAPIPGRTASTIGGRRISISRSSATPSPSASSRRCISRAIR